MMMQWLVNDFKSLKAEVEAKIQAILESPVIKDNDARISKLEGEIRALKARMGKQKD
jgi:hypothetical protein